MTLYTRVAIFTGAFVASLETNLVATMIDISNLLIDQAMHGLSVKIRLLLKGQHNQKPVTCASFSIARA